MSEKELGFRKAYKMTGTPGYAGGPGDKTIDKGASGSHRDNNWKIGEGQGKLKKAGKIGPNTNVKNEFGPKY